MLKKLCFGSFNGTSLRLPEVIREAIQEIEVSSFQRRRKV